MGGGLRGGVGCDCGEGGGGIGCDWGLRVGEREVFKGGGRVGEGGVKSGGKGWDLRVRR